MEFLVCRFCPCFVQIISKSLFFFMLLQMFFRNGLFWYWKSSLLFWVHWVHHERVFDAFSTSVEMIVWYLFILEVYPLFVLSLSCHSLFLVLKNLLPQRSFILLFLDFFFPSALHATWLCFFLWEIFLTLSFRFSVFGSVHFVT